MGLFSKFINKVIYGKTSEEVQKDLDEISEIIEKHRQDSSYFENSIFCEKTKSLFDYYSDEKEFLDKTCRFNIRQKSHL